MMDIRTVVFSGRKLALVIAVGIFLGGLANDIRQALWARLEIEMIKREAEKHQAEAAIRDAALAEQRAREQAARARAQAETRRQNELENEQKRAAIRQAKETCDFWSLQLRENPRNEQAKVMREAACDRLSDLR